MRPRLSQHLEPREAAARCLEPEPLGGDRGDHVEPGQHVLVGPDLELGEDPEQLVRGARLDVGGQHHLGPGGGAGAEHPADALDLLYAAAYGSVLALVQ